jgi:hypothetical protein
LSGTTTVAYAEKTGGIADPMVSPRSVASWIHATSASVPMRHGSPSFQRLTDEALPPVTMATVYEGTIRSGAAPIAPRAVTAGPVAVGAAIRWPVPW